MYVFVSRPMKIDTFLRKHGDHPKQVVDFPLKRDTFRNKVMEMVEDFDEKSYNNNSKPWKSSRILRVNPFFPFFFLFSSFFFIFSFFHFLHFSSFFFPIFFLPQLLQDFLYHFSSKNIFFSRLGGVGVYLFWHSLPFFSFFISFSFLTYYFLFFFQFFSRKKFLLSFFLVFLSNMFHCWHQYQSLTVSSVVGAHGDVVSWRHKAG